jgi:hypothetical protein
MASKWFKSVPYHVLLQIAVAAMACVSQKFNMSFGIRVQSREWDVMVGNSALWYMPKPNCNQNLRTVSST